MEKYFFRDDDVNDINILYNFIKINVDSDDDDYDKILNTIQNFKNKIRDNLNNVVENV